jgi:hypothetical protein
MEGRCGQEADEGAEWSKLFLTGVEEGSPSKTVPPSCGSITGMSWLYVPVAWMDDMIFLGISSGERTTLGVAIFWGARKEAVRVGRDPLARNKWTTGEDPLVSTLCVERVEDLSDGYRPSSLRGTRGGGHRPVALSGFLTHNVGVVSFLVLGKLTKGTRSSTLPTPLRLQPWVSPRKWANS